MLVRLPLHPNPVHLDRLVLDETTESRVVSFTTQCVLGNNLGKSLPRFKLEWLKQLMRTVDQLILMTESLTKTLQIVTS